MVKQSVRDHFLAPHTDPKKNPKTVNLKKIKNTDKHTRNSDKTIKYPSFIKTDNQINNSENSVKNTRDRNS